MPTQTGKRSRQEEIQEAAREAMAIGASAADGGVEMPPLGGQATAGGAAGTGTSTSTSTGTSTSTAHPATTTATATASSAATAAAAASQHPTAVEAADMDAIAAAVAHDVAAGEMLAGIEHAHAQAAAAAADATAAEVAAATAAGEAAAAAFIADQHQPMKRSRIDQIVGLGTGMEIDPHSQADLLQYAPSQAGSSKRSETWFNHFERLRAFKEETGHFHLPKRDPLSQWARDQRTQKAKQDKGLSSTLTPERREALESIGFPWRLWTKKTWEERIADLEAFRRANGHCDVPIRRDVPQSLATWVDEQRKLYRLKHLKGEKTALTDEREAQLTAMGFSWYRYGPTSWEDRVEDLKRYKAMHGDCLVPLKHKNDKTSEWKRLANWVSFQRLQYKKMKKGDPSSLLTEERRQELADIGFIFSVKDDNPSSNWNSMLDELYRYKSTHGSCNVPANFELNRRLAAWVRYVRDLYARKQAGEDVLGLSGDRISVLEGVGFQWTTTPDDAAVAAQIDVSDYIVEFAREDAAEAEAPPHAGKAASGFSRNETAWNTRLEELKAYKAIHNTCNVAWKSKGQKGTDPSIVTLGKWVSKQRSEYKKFQAGKKSQITEERIAALDAVGFEWAPGAVLVDWDVRLQQLIDYRNENGHTNVPKSYGPNPSLGQWVQTQRVYYKKWKSGKKSHLSEERRQKLEEIGFNWHVGNGRKPGVGGEDIGGYEEDPDAIAEAAAAAAASAVATV